MYPTFCSFRADFAPEDPHFAAVAMSFGLGNYRPALAIAEAGAEVEVLVAPDGRTVRLPRAAVRMGLREDAALGMMDAVEEAIEDALAVDGTGAATVAAMERTLALLERSLGDEFGEV
jgi:hypothetical protein